MIRRWFPSLLGVVLACSWCVVAHASPEKTRHRVLSKKSADDRTLPNLIDTELSLGQVLVGDAASSEGDTGANSLVPNCSFETGCAAGPHPVSRIAGMLLNIFLPFAIGSWVIGDFTGGFIGLFGQTIGVGLMFIAQFALQGFLAPAGVLIYLLGIALVTVGYVVPIFTVLFFQGRGAAGGLNSRRSLPPAHQDSFARATATQVVPLLRAQF